MLVSTVIPTYNYARFLPRALDSVFGQTYPNIECVVVDDGSTDNTTAVLAGYVNRYPDRLRVIRQENRGVSATRNVGIRATRGEAVACSTPTICGNPRRSPSRSTCSKNAPRFRSSVAGSR